MTEPDPHSDDRAAVYARVAGALAEHADAIRAAWAEALRASCPLYTLLPREDLIAGLVPIFDGYRRIYTDGNPAPLVRAVRAAAEVRFAQGFPLVAIEEAVGVARVVLLPAAIAEFAGEATHLAAAVDTMMTAEELCFICIAETYQERATEALRVAQEDVLRAEHDKVVFCREMARMATREKLVLCDHDHLPPRTDLDRLAVSDARAVRDARHAAAALARGAGWPEDRVYSLQLCVGEAGTNALRHAGGADFQVWQDGDAVTFRLADQGAGIDLCGIPAALRSGFSTGSTLGMGFPLMLDVADHIHLATDHHGTTIQITLSPA